MLQLVDIKKSFIQPDRQSVPILDIPHFEIAAGEMVALIGPSGCGKTTMLHTIAGITNPDAGQVFLDGIEMTKYSEAARDRIRADKLGYIFQTFNLLASFSALENVILGMTFCSRRPTKPAMRARATELLSEVGLSHRLHNKPSAMSVGEQQRVAIARSLANQPRLLLADEPTANVDPRNQQQMVELIKACCEKDNIALLIVTHSMEVANQFDRCVQLDELNLVVNRLKQTSP